MQFMKKISDFGIIILQNISSVVHYDVAPRHSYETMASGLAPKNGLLIEI